MPTERDTLDGGAGNDRLEGGQGSDILSGGTGVDTAGFERGSTSEGNRSPAIRLKTVGATAGSAGGQAFDSTDEHWI